MQSDRVWRQSIKDGETKACDQWLWSIFTKNVWYLFAKVVSLPVFSFFASLLSTTVASRCGHVARTNNTTLIRTISISFLFLFDTSLYVAGRFRLLKRINNRQNAASCQRFKSIRYLVIVSVIRTGSIVVAIVITASGRIGCVSQGRSERSGARVGRLIKFAHSLYDHFGLHGVLLQRF